MDKIENRARTGFEIALKKIEMDDFRGFQHLTMPFNNNDTIILISENGGGKTTVLDAIASGLKLFLWKLLDRPFLSPPQLSPKDINNGGSKTLNIRLDIEWKSIENEELEDGSLLSSENKVETNLISSIISLNSGKKKGDFRIVDNDMVLSAEIGSQFEYSNAFWKGYREEITFLPILAYYGANSINTMADTTKDVKEDEIYHIYADALEPNRFSFQSFHQWFDTMYKTYHTPNGTKVTALKIVCDAIEQILNDDMSHKIYENLSMKYHLTGNDMGIYKNNRWLEISQLSSGEKMIFAMVADMAKRLILANPDSDNPLEGKGIVLIDEIDLHLHPKWQRKVVGKLRELFPNVQFVVTTHSPLVLSNVYSKHIRTIENGNVYGVHDTFGHEDADDMLKIMGFEPELRKKIKTIHKLLALNKVEEAKSIREGIITEGVFAPLLEIDLFIQRKMKKTV